MDGREKLMQILNKPLFPEGKAPLEAVTDYLLENDVVPVVRCKDCKYHNRTWDVCNKFNSPIMKDNDFCSHGERRETHED